MNCLHDNVVHDPGAGESSGTIMGEDAEYVATPGGTFPGSMRHLLVSCFHKEYFTFFSQSGKFATGTLVRHYTSGSWVPVIVDITTNHGGYFAFKVTIYMYNVNVKYHERFDILDIVGSFSIFDHQQCY